MKDASLSSPSVRLFARYLRELGLPVTHQRDAVAAVVFSSDAHLSVDDIERSLRSAGERIGRATIYRTLDLLVRSKLVDEHDFGEGFKRYQNRLTRQPEHQHLVCVECSTVEEFPSPEMPAIEARVAREFGFRPTRHKLEVYGLCARCQAGGATLPVEGLACPIDAV
jgi:Fur family transcriptional regulator, ferric uptake regulator